MSTTAPPTSSPTWLSRLSVPGVVGLGFVALVLVWLGVNFVDAPANFLTVAMIGLTLGALYGLIALGYTLVYGILELINFAHGDLFMLGGLFASVFLINIFGIAGGGKSWFIVLLVLILVVILCAAFGAAINVGIELIAYRRLRNAPRLAPLITAVAMSFILQGIGLAWKGPRPTTSNEVVSEAKAFDINGFSLSWNKLVIILATIPVLIGLVWLVQKTRQGKAMRAVSQDMQAAAMMGINVNRTISFTFALGGALAGIAGVFWMIYPSNMRFDTGFQTGLIAFTAAVLGGIGNLKGAVLGSLVIGMIQAFNEGLSIGSPGSTWTQSIVFSILILILVFRPEGLLGDRTPEGQ